MSEHRPFSAADSVSVAAASLSRLAVKPVAIHDVRRLTGDERRNIILGASASGLDAASKPIIIKETRAADYDAAAVDAYDRFGLVKEWAAATLLARVARGRYPATLLASGTPRSSGAAFRGQSFRRPAMCAGHVPKAVADRIYHAYRAVLAEALPIVSDEDAFARERAIVCVGWLLRNLAWLLDGALKNDVRWGISMVRSRILYYLETAIEIIAEVDILPGTRRLAAGWLDDLRNRWPSSSPLVPYPGFSRDGGG
jgi:hypothetical protein